MATPHEPSSHEAFPTQPMYVALLAAWPMMEEKEGVEGRGYMVMDSPSHNETRYQNESTLFCDSPTVRKETYHGARTHYVALRRTTGDYHPPVHLSGYLAVLRRMRRVARRRAHAAPQPMPLTPLSITHTMTHI